MKIGIVLSKTPAYSETFFISKIKGLQENGFKVVLFCHSNEPTFNLCPVIVGSVFPKIKILYPFYLTKTYLSLIPHLKSVFSYFMIERKNGVSISKLFKQIYLNSHILKAKVDWLHFGFATIAINSEAVAKAIGAKMAVSFRGFDISVYPLKHPNCYAKLWKHVDKIHTISDDLLQLAYQNGLPKEIPSIKITPAIDANTFKNKHLKVRKPKNIINFLTVGRLHYMKGYVLMLEALSILKLEGIKFKYTIIGDTNTKEYERIAFAALQLNLQDEVIFKGRLSQNEISKEFEKTEIYLQYSLHEGFSNAVLEAQAAGIFCIVSNGGGLPENVLHNETGWVVPKNNPQLLAQQILKVLNISEEEKKRITTNAIKRVQTQFNLIKQQQEFIDFYTTTL